GAKSCRAGQRRTCLVLTTPHICRSLCDRRKVYTLRRGHRSSTHGSFPFRRSHFRPRRPKLSAERASRLNVTRLKPAPCRNEDDPFSWAAYVSMIQERRVWSPRSTGASARALVLRARERF